jgi:hypothetical protein
MDKVNEAKAANQKVKFTVGLPQEEKDKAAQAELDAETAVAKLCHNAAQDFLYMMRYAITLFPDDFRDLLRDGLKRSSYDKNNEQDKQQEHRDLAMALYLRLLDAGAVITPEGVKNAEKVSNLDKKLIPKFKEELLSLVKPCPKPNGST